MHLSIYPSIYIHPSIHPTINQSINLSIYLSIYLSIHLSVCHSYHLTNSFFPQYILVSIHPSIPQSVHLYIHTIGAPIQLYCIIQCQVLQYLLVEYIIWQLHQRLYHPGLTKYHRKVLLFKTKASFSLFGHSERHQGLKIKISSHQDLNIKISGFEKVKPQQLQTGSYQLFFREQRLL